MSYCAATELLHNALGAKYELGSSPVNGEVHLIYYKIILFYYYFLTKDIILLLVVSFSVLIIQI